MPLQRLRIAHPTPSDDQIRRTDQRRLRAALAFDMSEVSRAGLAREQPESAPTQPEGLEVGFWRGPQGTFAGGPLFGHEGNRGREHAKDFGSGGAFNAGSRCDRATG